VRDHPEYPAQAQQALEAMQIRPHVGKRYRLDEAPAALRDLAERKIIGKAVLVIVGQAGSLQAGWQPASCI